VFRSQMLQHTLAALVRVLLGSLQLTATDRPNVLLIIVDDLGWSNLACYGNPVNETRQIDTFSESAVRFTSAYATIPVCFSTRASIPQGEYPAKVGITDFIPDELKKQKR
jgi:arylsulfatase A